MKYLLLVVLALTGCTIIQRTSEQNFCKEVDEKSGLTVCNVPMNGYHLVWSGAKYTGQGVLLPNQQPQASQSSSPSVSKIDPKIQESVKEGMKKAVKKRKEREGK